MVHEHPHRPCFQRAMTGNKVKFERPGPCFSLFVTALPTRLPVDVEGAPVSQCHSEFTSRVYQRGLSPLCHVAVDVFRT